MKLNKISMMLAAVALVSCSDDLGERFVDPASQDSRLIELEDNFVIAGVGAENATTRTHWAQDGNAVVNQFLPILSANITSAQTLDNYVDNTTYEKVGLCWLGQTPNEKVYTNYEFYHYGWLAKGETDAIVECEDVTNGAMYDEITTATGTGDGFSAGDEVIPGTSFTAGGLPTKAKDGSNDNLNYNSGIYKTDNKSIFGGDYIVYYPFNSDFKEAGTIPAIAVTQFGDGTSTSAPTELKDPALGEATFRYSNKTTIEGGARAAGFGMYNLSTLVRLKVSTVTGSDAIADDDLIDQIVLYSANEQLLAKANLAADKIVAGAKGEALYASKEGTKTVVANFASPEELTGIDPTTTPATTASAYITVLPTTVEDLVVLVHKTNSSGADGKWAKVELGETEFEAGKGTKLDVVLKESAFNTEYIAVDEASLRAAIAEANTWLTTALLADPTATATIQVIGDIELSSDLKIIPSACTNAKSIIIQGDAIIVPEDVKLNVYTNMLSDINVLGKSCCSGTNGGILYVQGGTISNVTMVKADVKNPTDAQNPKVYFNANASAIAAGSTFDAQAGNVVVKKPVEQHEGDFNVAEGAKVTVEGTGDLNFMGATVVNNGTIEVLAAGHFDMTDKYGNATAADGQRMTNNGTFIHNVDAAVGTAVQKMSQNGEYRCKVNTQQTLDDAYLQWTACSVIEMVNSSIFSYDLKNACKHEIKGVEEYIDIEVNAGAATTFNNTPNDGNTINIGNLTAKSALDVDYVTGKRTLVVNGNVLVESTGTMTYTSGKAITVTGDITVDGATFEAKNNALSITCANFYLKNAGKATFGNRTSASSSIKTMAVSGKISNPAGCMFIQTAASTGNLLAWITCTTLEVGGSFPGGRPQVQ